MWYSDLLKNHFSVSFTYTEQARRQEFPEGGSSTRVALTAGGLGAPRSSGVFGAKS